MKITQLEICNNIVYINNGYDIIMAIVNVLLIIFESYSYGDVTLWLWLSSCAMYDESCEGITLELGTYHMKGNCHVGWDSGDKAMHVLGPG